MSNFKPEKKKQPVNRILIAGTEILNIDLNQGWEITEIKFNDCCPSSYIDKLDVIFEKQKKENKMYNEQNIGTTQTGTTQTSETESVTINPPKIVGWICPICGRGLSPYTTACPCKGWFEGKWEVTC